MKIFLHAGKNYMAFEPPEKGLFTVIEFGPPCSLEGPFPVSGALVAECGKLEPLGTFVQVDCATHQKTPFLRQAPQALFSEDALTVGKNSATLGGIAIAELGGKLEGLDWGGTV